MSRVGLRATSALLLLAAGCASARPERLPSMPTQLAPCPSSPNCVSSQATDAAHHVDPIPYRGDHVEAMRRLRAVIEAMPRARVVDADDLALRAEFTSRIFRFVDDVDCVVDPQAHVIEIRSASRIGYSDLGANRARVEAIRAAFAQSP
jgi:uncharacterized protein (DUF1499 family)